MSVEVPVIDFSRLSTSNSEECLDVESIKTIGDQVFSALKETGFLYLKNTGLEKEEVLKSNGIMEQFFLQSKDVKQKFARGSEIHRHHGWMDTEYPDPTKPADLKEGFNCVPIEVTSNEDMQWPSDDFQEIVLQLYNKLNKIATNMCRVLAVAFGKNLDFFTRHHTKMGAEGNPTLLKFLYYYPLKKSDLLKVEEGALRCSEHTDKTTFTFLISEDITGLQVMKRNGEWVNLTKAEEPNYILVNMGELMNRWSDDELTAANHRVVYKDVYGVQGSDDAEDPIMCPKRQSMAYFVAPDIGQIVTPFRESSRYAPTSVEDFFAEIVKQLYKWDKQN